MLMNQILGSLTIKQLKQAIAIKEKIESLERQLASAIGGSPAPVALRKMRRKISATGRANIAAAQRARRARQKGNKSVAGAAKGKRRLSAEGRQHIIEATKARWAAYREAKAAKAAKAPKAS